MGKYFGLRGNALNLAIAFTAGCDFLLFGYDQGVMGGLLTLNSFKARFPRIDTDNPPPGSDSSTTANVQGITVASYNLGCFFGAIAAIWLGNRLGRRRMMMLGSSIMVVGATLQCTSFHLPQLIVGRIVTGIGNGINTSTVAAWQAETSKSHNRGQIVMIEGAMISGGICLSYWIDFGFSYLEPSEVSWRFPIAFQILFALIICCFVLPLPESPRFLVLEGKIDEARSVLCALNDLPEDDPYIKLELEAIKETVSVMSSGSFRDLFSRNKDRHLHRTILAYCNQMFQQINGINLITYYAATIYVRIGLSDFLSRLLAALNGTEYFLASFIPVFLVERVGRRPLMLVGSAGMCISMVFLAGFTSRPDNSGLGVGAAVFLFVFNTFFAIGWLGMSWLYPAEIVPLRIRAPANALATSANWIFNFMVVMITPPAFENIQYRTYIIFAVINAFIFPCVYLFYVGPETARRSLEEMDEIFHKADSIWSVVSIAERHPRRYDKNGHLNEPESPLDSEEAALSSGQVTRVGSSEQPPTTTEKEKTSPAKA